MSPAAFLMGVATGVLGTFAGIGLMAAAIHAHAREVDQWFTRQVSPVPSHVRIIAGQVTK